MQPVSTRISLARRQGPLLKRPAGVDKRPAVALKTLHDEALTAEQTDAELALKSNADRHAFRSRQEGVFLRDQLATDLGEMDRDDLARIRGTKGDALLLTASIEKYSHEERLAGQAAASLLP